MRFKTKVTFESSGNLRRLADEFEIPIQCPQCGHETKQRLARLKHDPTITCPGCSTVFKCESGGTARDIADKIGNIDGAIKRALK